MSKTILITGGAGFIGSNFVDYIFRTYPDYRVVVLDALTYAGSPDNLSDEIKKSPRFEFWYGNVTNDDLVSQLISRANIVVHFAAESHVARSIFDNKIFYVTDVLGTQAVSNAIARSKTVERFIHISTSEVYGTAITNPMTEDHPLNPLSPYASAKAGADRLVYSYIASYNIPATIIRPFNQFGPRQHLEKVIPRFITSALLDEPLTVHGDGSAIRDWLYVEDTCKRLDKVIQAPIDKIQGEVFNLGSGFDLDIMSIAKMVLEICKKPNDMVSFIGDRPGQVHHHISSTDKAERVLGIEAPRSFEKGLEQTIHWYQNNRAWWEKLIWMRHVPIMTESGKVEYH
ncbi:MAG TPA: GDP-mannose 4,6-dehydratase [Candidatus Kapabacteria bacterium]|nr:GDP-mannose 4,6-dehydratase [Candidatus Kapabacteria bacterium]